MAEFSLVYQNHVIKERNDSLDSGVEELDEVSDFSPTISTTTPSYTKNVAVALGVYISLEISGLSHLDTRPLCLKNHKKSLKTLVEKIIQDNHLLFERMIKKLQIKDPLNSQHVIRQVAKQLFTDSQTNWGRIVTLYAFVAELARHGEKSFSMYNVGDYSKMVGKVIGEYIGDELSQWIIKQGGWDKLVSYAQKEDSIEVKFLKGMLFTIFGIGVFATWKVMR